MERYIKIKVFAESHKLEDMAAVLVDEIVLGVEINDPRSYEELAEKKNQYDWDYIDPEVEKIKNISPNIEFYIEDTPEGLELLDDALEIVRIFDPTRVEVSEVSNRWQEKWKEYLEPFHIGKKIVIRPSWKEYEKKPGELVIDIDPGMAFGTGNHPTSRLTILLLEESLKEGMDVLDIGTGSGILSIAAALLGAEKIMAVEIDPKALVAAEENILKNKQENKIDLVEGDLNKGIDFKADIVVANLVAGLVIELAATVRKNLKDRGVFISSGILLEKKEEVVEGLKKAGFIIDGIKEEGEWCAIRAS